MNAHVRLMAMAPYDGIAIESLDFNSRALHAISYLRTWDQASRQWQPTTIKTVRDLLTAAENIPYLPPGGCPVFAMMMRQRQCGPVTAATVVRELRRVGVPEHLLTNARIRKEYRT